jgi:hypothetical protein
MSKTMTKRETAIQKRKLTERATASVVCHSSARAGREARLRQEIAEDEAQRKAEAAERALPPKDLRAKYARLSPGYSETRQWLAFEWHEQLAARAVGMTEAEWLADPVQNARLEAAIAAKKSVDAWIGFV